MIEQLWYTWSTSGLGSALGFRVRAASPGLRDINSELFRAIDPYLQYTLPVGTMLEQAQVKNSPVCITFAEAANKRILVQRVFAGKDAYGRIGNYFCHLVTELTELKSDFCAQDAISFWGSSFWRVSDHELAEGQTELDPVSPHELVSGSLSRNDLAPIRQYLPFVIQAFLSLKDNQQLYIMAPDIQVSALIWGLTRCLPRSLQQHLTFSTYEYDVLTAKTRIVGTCQPVTRVLDGFEGRVADLPAQCYNVRGFALNCYVQDRYSQLAADNPLIAAYANFAAKALLGNGAQAQKLDALLEKADLLGIATPEDFFVIYRFFMKDPQEFSLDDIIYLLSRPAVATELLTEVNIQQAVIRFALSEPQWWDGQDDEKKRAKKKGGEKKSGEEALKALEEYLRARGTVPWQHHPFAAFAELVVNDLYYSLIQNDPPTYFVLSQILDAIAPRPSYPTPWLLLLRHFQSQTSSRSHPLHDHSPQVRRWFLETWVLFAQYIDDAMIARWLIVLSWRELQELLELELPDQWRILAIKNWLIDSTAAPPSNVSSLVVAYQELFKQALRQLIQEDAQIQVVAQRFFAALVRDGYQDKLDLLLMLLSPAACGPACIVGLLRAADLSSQEKRYIFERLGYQLLVRSRESKEALSLVLDLAEKYMRSMTVTRLSEKKTSLLLEHLSQLSLPEPLASSVLRWHLAGQGIMTQSPPVLTVKTETLTRMAQAIADLHLYQDEHYWEGLFLVLINNVYSKNDLLCVIRSMWKPLVGSPKTFFLTLVTSMGAAYNPQIDHERLIPYIIVALDDAMSLSGRSQEHFLDEVFSALFKNVDRTIFDRLSRSIEGYGASRQLSAEQMALWRKFGMQYRPQSHAERIVGGLKNITRKNYLPGFLPKQQPPRPTPPPPPEPTKTTLPGHPAQSTPPAHNPVMQERPSRSASSQDMVVNGMAITDEQVKSLVQVQDLFLLLCEANNKAKNRPVDEVHSYRNALNEERGLLKADEQKKQQIARQRYIEYQIIEMGLPHNFSKEEITSLKKEATEYREKAVQYLQNVDKRTYRDKQVQDESRLDIYFIRMTMAKWKKYELGGQEWKDFIKELKEQIGIKEDVNG